MKKCPSCGAEWQDNVVFCGKCGTKTEDVPVFDNLQSDYTETPMLSEEAASLYEEPQSFYYEESKAETNYNAKKNRKPLIITIIAVLAVLIIGVIVGLLTNWFGLTSPMRKIANAFNNTITAESMTVKLSLRETYSGNTYSDTISAKFAINPEAEQLTLWAKYDNEEIMLVDDMLYRTRKYDDYTRAYINDNFLDTDAFFEAYNDYINDKNFETEKMEEIVDQLGASDYIYADELEGLIEEVMKEYLFNQDWLEKNAGFEKSGNVYTFEPNVKKIFKDAINICEETDAFSDDLKDELIEVLYYGIDEWEEMEVDEFKISITIKKKVIEEIKIIFESEDYSFKLTISISDVNKTVISEDDIDDFADKANRIIAENLCPTCGKVDYYKDHGNCVECGEHQTYLYSDSKCYDCYYSSSSRYGYCDFCYDYAYLYSYGSYDLCWDCYYDY